MLLESAIRKQTTAGTTGIIPFLVPMPCRSVLHHSPQYVVKDIQFIEYLRMVRIERIDELEAAGVQVTCPCSGRQQTFSSPLSLLQCFFMT